VKNNPLLDRLRFDTKEQITTLSALQLEDVSTVTKEEAQNNLEKIDSAITKINGNRSSLGALQNRIQSTINNLNIYRENLEGANSRIRDTDMAEETAQMTKYNILSQANIAMLGQANSVPQLALKLL